MRKALIAAGAFVVLVGAALLIVPVHATTPEDRSTARLEQRYDCGSVVSATIPGERVEECQNARSARVAVAGAVAFVGAVVAVGAIAVSPRKDGG